MADFVFHRDGLPDAKIETPLTPEELQFIEIIHMMEEGKEFQERRMSGAVNEYLRQMRVPYGFLLQKPRSDLLGRLQKTEAYLASHERDFGECAEVANNIRKSLKVLLTMMQVPGH